MFIGMTLLSMGECGTVTKSWHEPRFVKCEQTNNFISTWDSVPRLKSGVEYNTGEVQFKNFHSLPLLSSSILNCLGKISRASGGSYSGAQLIKSKPEYRPAAVKRQPFSVGPGPEHLCGFQFSTSHIGLGSFLFSSLFLTDHFFCLILVVLLFVSILYHAGRALSIRNLHGF